MPKLTPENREELVRQARLPGANYTEIAKIFRVTPQLVWNYANGRYRKYPKVQPIQPTATSTPQTEPEAKEARKVTESVSEEGNEPGGDKKEEGGVWKEQNDALRVLKEVLTNKNLKLKPEQIEELLDWAGDSPSGALNPYELNQLLIRMEGISPKTAAYIAMKYNSKLVKLSQEHKEGMLEMPLIRSASDLPQYSPWFATAFGLPTTPKKRPKMPDEEEEEEEDDEATMSVSKMARRLRKAQEEGMILRILNKAMEGEQVQQPQQTMAELQEFVYKQDGELAFDKQGRPLVKTNKVPVNMLQMMQPSMNPQIMALMSKLSDQIGSMNQQQVVGAIDKLGTEIKAVAKEGAEGAKDTGWGILIPHLLDEVKEARQAASEGKNVFGQLEEIGKGLKTLQDAGFFGAPSKEKQPTAGEEIGKALKAAGVPELSKAASKWIEKGGLDKAFGSGNGKTEAGGKFENIQCAHCGNVMQVPMGVSRVKCTKCGELLDLTTSLPPQPQVGQQDTPGERLMAKVKCGECGHEFTTIFRPEVPCPKCKKINVLKKPEEGEQSQPGQ